MNDWYFDVTAEEVQERFWTHLVHKIGYDDRGGQALTLFNAIDYAYSRGHETIIDGQLAQYMAGWCRDLLLDKQKKNLKVIGNDSDYMLNQAYRGLLSSLKKAIGSGEHKMIDGQNSVEGLRVPEWFFSASKVEAEERKRQKRECLKGRKSIVSLAHPRN